MKRIAIGLLQQETNVLNPVTTQREDFAIYGLVQGPAVIAAYGVGDLAQAAMVIGFQMLLLFYYQLQDKYQMFLKSCL